jgi:hypothetical protein
MGYNFYMQTVTVYHKFLAVLDIFREKTLYGLPLTGLSTGIERKYVGLLVKNQVLWLSK